MLNPSAAVRGENLPSTTVMTRPSRQPRNPPLLRATRLGCFDATLEVGGGYVEEQQIDLPS